MKDKRLYIANIQAFLVTPSGEVSNLLHEDYEAVLKFMNMETQKRDLKLK